MAFHWLKSMIRISMLVKRSRCNRLIGNSCNIETYELITFPNTWLISPQLLQLLINEFVVMSSLYEYLNILLTRESQLQTVPVICQA